MLLIAIIGFVKQILERVKSVHCPIRIAPLLNHRIYSLAQRAGAYRCPRAQLFFYMSDEKVVATNREAYHNFHILETHECGIALTGTEVKSAREGRCNLKDGYGKF